MNKIKIPKNQISWLIYRNENQEPQYLVTSDIQRTKYYLYKVNQDNSLTKLKSSVKPTFEEVGYYK